MISSQRPCGRFSKTRKRSSVSTNQGGQLKDRPLNTFRQNFLVVSKPGLNSFADLIGAAEFGPELLVLLFPAGTEFLVKEVTQLFEEQFPGRFSRCLGAEEVVQDLVDFRQLFFFLKNDCKTSENYPVNGTSKEYDLCGLADIFAASLRCGGERG